jgi:hypothetical protein
MPTRTHNGSWHPCWKATTFLSDLTIINLGWCQKIVYIENDIHSVLSFVTI